MNDITSQDFIGIANKDLVRLGKKYELDIEPKSEFCHILWEGPIICLEDYPTFKTSYLEFEKALRPWLDSQRWLHKVNFSDCWLTLRVFDGSIKFLVCKSA